MSSHKKELDLASRPVSADEVESQDPDLEKLTARSSIDQVHILKLALTVVALALGLTILGTSAASLATYKTTRLPRDFLLRLWPDEFDLGPTTALVTGGALVLLSNAVSLLFDGTFRYKTFTQRSGLLAAVRLFAPAVGFVAALVAVAIFYSADASASVDTLKSWTCRWEDVPMTVAPRWSALCRQSQAAVVLSTVLVPLEALILGFACYQVILERRTGLHASPML